jgi:signal transduction histidine kinase/ActR/RegA family two-component response regulator
MTEQGAWTPVPGAADLPSVPAAVAPMPPVAPTQVGALSTPRLRLGLAGYRVRPGRVLAAIDDAATAWFGRCLAGLPLAEIDRHVVDGDRERVAAARAAALASPLAAWTLRYAVLRADGSTGWIEDRFAGDGSGAGDGVLIDVGERERLHGALAAREARHRRALAAADVGVWESDAAGHVRLSARARQLFGLDAGGGDPGLADLAQALHADDRARVLAAIDGLLHGAGVFDEELRVRTTHGGWRWLHARGARVGAQPGHSVGVVADVTARRLSEQILKDSEARLRAVLAHVSEAILTLDAEGRVRSFNAAAERMFGRLEAEVAGEPFRVLVPGWPQPAGAPGAGGADAGDARPASGMPVAAGHAAAGGGDLLGRHRDGHLFAIEVAVARVLIGNAEMSTAVVRDVSAQRRSEAELRDAKEKAEAAARAKAAFLATMSHELRTPLNGVLGMARLLADTDLTPAQREATAAIRQSGEALLAIIDDVLDAARIDAGRLVVRSEPFDLEAVLREVATLLAPRLAERGIEFIVDFAPAVPRRLDGDAARVRQVLLNLVGNAVKFTEHGHVAMRVLAGAGMVTVAVEDTGCGIDEAFRGRLFGAFEQADTSSTRRHGGTGLGLAISRQIVQMLGGELTCDSRVGIGSVFRFTLPWGGLPAAVPAAGAPFATGVTLTIPYGAVADVLARDLAQCGHEVRRGRAPPPGGGAWVVDWSALDPQRLDGHGLPLADAVVLLPLAAHRARTELEARGACVLMKPVFASDVLAALAAMHGRHAAGAAAAPAPGLLPRALVVEDNLVNQRVAQCMLERLGFAVDVAADGREALAAWRRDRHGVVLMDCQMPVMDGFAATAAMRADERAGVPGARRSRIVAMTANALPDDERRCLDAGMDGYVAKPVTVEGLAAALGVDVGRGGGAAVDAVADGTGATRPA